MGYAQNPLELEIFPLLNKDILMMSENKKQDKKSI